MRYLGSVSGDSLLAKYRKTQRALVVSRSYFLQGGIPRRIDRLNFDMLLHLPGARWGQPLASVLRASR